MKKKSEVVDFARFKEKRHAKGSVSRGGVRRAMAGTGGEVSSEAMTDDKFEPLPSEASQSQKPQGEDDVVSINVKKKRELRALLREVSASSGLPTEEVVRLLAELSREMSERCYRNTPPEKRLERCMRLRQELGRIFDQSRE